MRSLLLIILTLIFYSCSSENEQISEREIETITKNESLFEINYANGKMLFKTNCAACHGENQKVIAVPFQNIREDYDLEWIFSFIRNNDSLIKGGDIRANYVFEIHNQLLMPKFTSLTDQQIIDILDYVDSFPILYNYYDHRKIPVSIMKDSIKEWKNYEEKYRKQTLRRLQKSG